MTQANTNLRVAELDFDQIKNNLKTYLSSQSEFVDYDFEGSGLAVLLDSLAYNTHYLGFYLNMVANEMFGDTAQLRNSILSHAHHVGYKTGSMVGSKVLVDIVATPNPVTEDATSNTATLAKYTKFISAAKDGTNYQFVTLNANTAVKESGSFTWSNVWLTQGEVVVKQYLMSTGNVNRRFNIPSANVDTNTITVVVQESTSNTTKSLWTEADDITEVRANSQVYWIEENSVANGQYTLYFGDGNIGKKPANGNIILVSYLDVSGEGGNGLETFVSTDPVDTYTANVTVTAASKSAGGADKETIEEIRHRAPLHYTSQNRAVTEDDYKLLLLRDYPNIDAVSVWSGAQNDPPVYGKVFISMKPKENYVLSTLEKTRIKNEIISGRSIMTAIPEIIDPDYTYLLIRAKVNYNPKVTSLSADEIKALVRQSIIDYRDTDLQTFDSVFRQSKLHRLVDSAEKSIVSSEFTVFLQKRIDLTTGETKTYDIDYKLGLKKALFPDQAYSYPSFVGRDLDNVERNLFYEVTPDSFTGVDSITVNDPGSDYTETPTVTISGDGTGATAEAVIVNGKVQSINVTERGSNYSRATVAITGGGNGSGASATVVLGGDTGVLRTFFYKDNGEKSFVNETAGTIRFDTGSVALSEVLPLSVTQNSQYANNVLTFNIQPDSETISYVRNRILDIDVNDPNSIVIEMIAEDV
jgi:hypothetical protein